MKQKVNAGRDVFVARRDLTFNLPEAGIGEFAVPGLLPRDVPGFTGRDDELARLAGLAGGGRVVVSAIGGTAGVGKTALAVHAAHQLLAQFPDGHLYADLRGYTEGQHPAQPGEVLEMFLRSLGVPAEDVLASVEERSGQLRQLLAARRVVMVLDNASTEGQVRPLLPGAGGSLVLVTSRSLLPGLEADERISLDVLPPDEAAAMFAALAGPRAAAADPAAVADVVRLCGRLPLALRIAGQLLAAHRTWPVARLTLMLASEQDRLARLGAGDLQVRTAFEVSYRQLTGGDARLFRLLGLHPGPDFAAAAAAALAGTEDDVTESALSRLTEAHLVTEDAAGRYGMHDLLRLFARATCQEADTHADQDAAQNRLISHYTDLAAFLHSCINPELRQAAEQAGMPLCSMREALAVFQGERPALLAALGLAAQQGRDAQVHRLSESMGESLRILRYLDDLLTVREAELAVARREGNTPAESRALNNLGVAFWAVRRFEEAITSYQQALAIFREAGDRHGEGSTLHNLGTAYHELRRFEEAIASYQQTLVIKRATGDPRGEGLTLNNLGVAYRDLWRFEEATVCYQQALVIFQEAGDRHGEGQTLNNLGVAYRDLRRFEEAFTSHQQALAIFQESGDRHGEGTALNFLGHAYQEMRQPDQAAACWREAAAAMRDVGVHEEAARLEQLAANTPSPSPSRRRWWRRASRPPET